MEFKKILVALGQDSRSGSSLIRQALAEGEKNHAELVFFACYPQDTVAEVEGRVGALTELDMHDSLLNRNTHRKHELDHCKAWLEQLCRQAGERGLKAKPVIEIGDPGRQIIQIAEHWGADLIVLGRTQRGSLADCLFGTVSDYVIHHARCSLLLVQ